jgi:hypothetical protein
VAELLDHIAGKITNNPSFWNLYAYFYQRCGHHEKALECRLRAYRALQISGWEKDPVLFDSIAKTALDIVADNESQGTKQSIFQAKMLLQHLIGGSKDYFHDQSLHHELKQTLAQIDEKLSLMMNTSSRDPSI